MMNSFKITLKNLAGFINKIFMTLISLSRILLLSGFNSKLKRIKIESIDECYILGNGPSLKKDIYNKLGLLIGKNLIVVNNFASYELYEKLRPNLYVLTDPVYWRENSIRYEANLSILDKIIEKTTWKLFIFIPYDGYKKGLIKNKFEGNSLIEVVYYNTRAFDGFDFIRHFLYRKNLSMPTAKNVLLAAIYLSLNLGMKRTNLLGADHSWLTEITVGKDNQVYLIDKHFYDENIDKKPWLKIDGRRYLLHEILEDLSDVFRGYHELKLYGETLNADIVNLTQDSFIDAFKRGDF